MKEPKKPQDAIQDEYDKIPLCRWCDAPLCRLGKIPAVKCPACGRKTSNDVQGPHAYDSVDFCARGKGQMEIKGEFSEETARLLREQIEGVYDYNDLKYQE